MYTGAVSWALGCSEPVPTVLWKGIVRILAQQMTGNRIGYDLAAKSGGIKVEPTQDPEQKPSAQLGLFLLQPI